ncbi:hypothetical protein FRUB_08936 [Fimbriiglobus ruber]|uniref:Uncharacterized protein n=1 Tax=Fimbriiglobus ruber TaxID=1908690 RepID=A0A225D5X1_9BACT|nr:hypothetical protein FRUB_08936 [Fimbriiglobus ruber]
MSINLDARLVAGAPAPFPVVSHEYLPAKYESLLEKWRLTQKKSLNE